MTMRHRSARLGGCVPALFRLQSRRVRTAAAVLALICLPALAACGDAPLPEPTPPAAASPTATPAPVPTATFTPVPATPTPAPAGEPGPAGSMEDFAITASTTGRDLVDRLSGDEVACIRTTLGDLLFQVLVSTPLLEAGTNTADAAPVFGCLTKDNVVYFAVAFIDTQAGGWTAETRMCVVEVGGRYPEAVLVNLGVEAARDDTAAETQAYILALYECLADGEKEDLLIRLQATLDRSTSAGRDIIAVLPEPEAACVRESLSEDRFAELLDATVHEAFADADALSGCLSGETYVQIFVAITESLVGGLGDGSRGCLEAFGREHPDYVGLIRAGIYGTTAMTAAEFRGIVEDGLGMFECLSDGELRRIQGLAAEALSGS